MKHLILIATLAAPASALAQTAISPGYWEATNQVTSPFPTKKTERRCIRAADVAKFMNGPSNHIYTCTYPTREIGGGRIRLAGSCKTRDGKPVPISDCSSAVRLLTRMRRPSSCAPWPRLAVKISCLKGS